jgi:hypothetical protein
MAYKEMFFVQVFEIDSKNRLIGGRSYSLPSADEAKLKASWLSQKVAGVVAFSQLVDDKAHDAEEPVLLAFHGRVPPEARAAAA